MKIVKKLNKYDEIQSEMFITDCNDGFILSLSKQMPDI